MSNMEADQLPGRFFGPATLVQLVRHRARCQANDIAFTYLVDGEDEEIHLTYQELDRKARAIGAWLESLGLAGQRALLLYPPGLDFITGFFGCLYAGVIAVPVYPPRRNRSMARIQAIADDARARVALTTEEVLHRVEPLIDATPHLKHLAWLDTSHVPHAIDQQWQMPHVHADTLAFLQYTSGSTGSPKGVVLSHANLLHNSALISYAFEHTQSVVGVFWLPSYHDMGLIGGILQPLYIGRPNVLMSPMTFLQKPYRWLSAISRFRGTTSGGPNFAYDLCVRKITPEQRKTLDLSCWQVAFNGAEPVRAETLARFAEVFGPCGFRREAFYPCYGLAEATLLVSGSHVARPPLVEAFAAKAIANGRVMSVPADDPDAHRLVGCGRTLPDQKIVIADPETQTIASPGRVGEIWVQGPSVAQGYWQQPEPSEATFRAYLRDTGEGPFLRTGDVGFLQAGELYVTGRLKDLIIIRGVNYYPQDLELAVQQAHARLRPDCGAAFLVEGDGREHLILVHEVERHKQGNFEPVFKAMRQAIASEFDLALDAVVLIKAGTIPKTSSGKIQRHACREGFLAGKLDMVACWPATASPAFGLHSEPSQASQSAVLPPAPPAVSPALARPSGNGSPASGSVNGRSKVTDAVLDAIRRVAKERCNGMTLDSSIGDGGLDSLERMEILASLEERFGGRFPLDIVGDLETPRQLIAAVEQHFGSEPLAGREQPAGSDHPTNCEIPPETYCVERFPEYLQLRKRLDLVRGTGIGNPYFGVHQGITNDRTTIGGRQLINFASYNYLGTSGDPLVSKAAQAAIDRYGTSVSASRLASGEKELHGDLEQALAGFLGTPAAITFVGGHATNETVIGHLLARGDLILHDALVHNSILQGAILSGAQRRQFPHNDAQAAGELLAECRPHYRRVLLVVEGVYSMDGDIPDLPRFIEVKRRYKTLMMIDEAHSLGVLGPTGRGIGEHFGVDRSDVDLWMGTMSKSLGSCGGYIAGSTALIEYLKYTAPGFVFSVGLSPPAAAAALAALRLLQSQPQRVAALQQNARLFLSLAQKNGLQTGTSKDTPVVPIIVGSSLGSLRLSQALFARGINVQPILYPAVEESAARLRFFLTSLHTEEQIRYTIEVLTEELAALAKCVATGSGLAAA